MSDARLTHPRIFISAAEPSGDMHAAALIREVCVRCPGAQFVGVAGPAMQAAGCRALGDLTPHSGMLLGAIGNAGRATVVLRRTTQEFTERGYHAVVVIDSPMLHLPLALRARMRGIPVLYYVAPQLWAWGEWRMHRLRARVDKLAVILPFEEEYFRGLGLDATYVGHPLFDTLADRQPTPEAMAEVRSRGRPVVALLPGSRRHVVEEVLPGQLEVAAAIRQRFPRVHVGISVAHEGLTGLIESHVERSRLAVRLYPAPNGELLSAADLTLVASGTATLEVAHYGSPMIAMYRGSRLLYHLLGRWLVRLKRLSLINILARRDVVPEFMPYYRSTAPIARCAVALLSSPDRLRQMRDDLATVMSGIDRPGASARTAELLLAMIRNTHA